MQKNDIFASTFQLCGTELLAPRRLYKDYPLSGSPASMAFASATCRCIKYVGHQTLHMKNCTREMILHSVLPWVHDETVLANMMASIKCWNKTAADVYHRAYPKGHYARYFNESILYSLLLVPWSNCLISSQSDVFGFSGQRSAESNDRKICPHLSNTTRIILTPSPGEQFDLNLEALDEFLQPTSTLASLTVCASDTDCDVETNVPPALVVQAGTEYGAAAQLYFNPMLPLNDLSLVGPVGATGNLRILWASYLRGFFCSLYIPFQLNKCHKGFDPPYANSDLNWTEEYIKDSLRVSRPVSKNLSRLKCTCSARDGVVCDKNGRTATVENRYWAGTLHAGKGKETEEFVSHSCLGQCSHDRGVDADGYWTYDAREPDKHCSDLRSGILCRVCQDGYSETLAGRACERCESRWSLGVVLYAMVVAVLGILLVSVSMLTRLLGNQYFDAWIFYVQIVPLILRPGEEVSLLHSVARYTVSLIHLNFPLCVAPYLSELPRLIVVAVPSMYLFFLVFILFLASYLRRVSHYVRRPKVGETFFVVLIVAYEPLAVFCTFTLSCTVLLGDDVRLYADPNIVCFGGEHLPYSIAAICVLCILIIFPALLIYGARDSTSSTDSTGWFRFLSKACARSYTSKRRWWIGITLWRRFVIAALAATITTDLTTRQIVLFSICLALLLFSAVILPYRLDAANKYELLLLTNLSLIAALGINDVTIVTHTKQLSFSYILLALLAWPDISIIILAVYKNRKRCVSCWKRQQNQGETGTEGDREHQGSQTTSFSEVDSDGKRNCGGPWEASTSEMRDRLLTVSFSN